MNLLLVVMVSIVSAKIYFCIDSLALSDDPDLSSFIKKNLQRIISHNAIIILSETAMKNTANASEFDAMINNVYANLDNPEMVKIHMKDYIKSVLLDFDINLVDIDLSKNDGYINSLIITANSTRRLKKLKFLNIKSFNKYKKSESFFAFFNLIIEDVLNQEMCKAWMLDDNYDVHLSSNVKEILTKNCYNHKKNLELVLSSNENDIVEIKFDLFNILKNRDASKTYIDFRKDITTKDDHLIYIVEEFSAIMDFSEWCGHVYKPSDSTRKAFLDALSIVKKKLMKSKKEFIEYGQSLGDKGLKNFGMMIVREPFFYYYRTDSVLQKRFGDIKTFQRFYKNMNKVYGLMNIYMKLIFNSE